VDLTQAQCVYLEIPDIENDPGSTDNMNLSGDVTEELMKMGLSVITGERRGETNCETRVRYNYSTKWNLMVYVGSISVEFVDAKSGKVIASATTKQNGPFLAGACLRCVEPTFAELNKKIEKKGKGDALK
jgi:hypothetical protein